MTPRLKLAALIAATSFCAASYTTPSNAADTVELKSGLVLLGEIVEDNPANAEIVLHTGPKQVTLPRKDIAQIHKDTEARAEFKKRQSALEARDARGHFALFQWAQERKLFVLAQDALKTAAAADPNHAGARKALGLDADEASQQDFVVGARTPASSDNEKSKADRVAYEKSVQDQIKLLARSDTSEASRGEVVSNLVRDKDKVGDVLLGSLDFRKVTDHEVRLGALKGIEAIKPDSPRVSPTLAWSAVLDPSADVRKQVVGLIKDRKDDVAVGGMIRHLIGAFNQAGEVIHIPVRDNAVEGLRLMKDDRIGSALFTYCVMELRPTQTEGTLQPGFIQSFTVLTGAQVTIIIPLTFPIDFPNLQIRRVRTTVSAPAAALRAYAGKDLGADVDAWKAWLGKK